MVRVLVVFGTRPEAIKMAPVVARLKATPGVETIVCVTAQHREMLDQVLDIFNIRPDHDLNLMRADQTLPDLTAGVLTGMGRLIAEVKPDRVLVHGDTTTTMACGLAAFYARVPVGHVEAGLRTGDLGAPWPEELNRRVVDIFADLLWAPTPGAAKRLLQEGAPLENVIVTGNTVIDALHDALRIIERDAALQARFERDYAFLDPSRRLVLVTGHRREHFDGGLDAICQAVNRIAARDDVSVLWPLHPNPTVLRTVRARLQDSPNVRLVGAMDYLGFVEAMRRSAFIITDSGGVQEEGPSIGKPVLVTRERTERPEAVAAGVAALVGPREDDIVQASMQLLDDPAAYAAMTRATDVYGRGDAAERIVRSIVERAGG